MLAALPPSSSVSGMREPARCRMICLPTSVEPVKASLSMPSCAASAAPVAPSPVTTFTTPGGRSASAQISASRSAVSGVVSAGLSTAQSGVAQLVGPARVVQEVRRRGNDVEVARLLDRFAVVERFEHRQLARRAGLSRCQ
jgi:hypothetical protein